MDAEDGAERLRRVEEIVGPEAVARARRTVRETTRLWEEIASHSPAARDDQDAGSGSDPPESDSA
jgi:hypothetical protein